MEDRMFNYGRTQSVNIPGPELEVSVSSPDGSEEVGSVVCLIDTAATTSVLPKSIVKRLDLKDYDFRRVTWGSGKEDVVKIYAVNLRVGNSAVNKLWVLVCDKGHGLIGRDVLNAHLLTCDGPNKVWAVEPDWL
jgi:predicted aspartyl protease